MVEEGFIGLNEVRVECSKNSWLHLWAENQSREVIIPILVSCYCNFGYDLKPE